MRWLVAVVMAGLLLAASSASASVIYSVEGSILPRREAAGGPTVVFSDNFEPTPETTPCDSGGSQEVASNTIGDTETCDYTDTALAGSESMWIPGCTDERLVSMFFEGTFSAGISSGTMTFKMLHNTDAAGTSSGYRSLVQFYNDSTANGPQIKYRQSVARYIAVSDDADDSTVGTVVTSVGTTYKVCGIYQFTGDIMTVYVDAAGGTYCAGAIDEIEADGTGDFDGDPLNGARFYGNYGSAIDCMDQILDNIEVSYE